MQRIVEENNGAAWNYEEEANVEADGTMWIMVAKRCHGDDSPWLGMETANVHTIGCNYTGYHHMDSYAPEDNGQKILQHCLIDCSLWQHVRHKHGEQGYCDEGIRSRTYY